MTGPPRTILQVNTRDTRGGAEGVALNLHRLFSRRGLRAVLAVGERNSDTSGVVPLSAPGRDAEGARAWDIIADRALAPLRFLDARNGRESFRYPLTGRLPVLTPEPPDVILAHNLHGGYFDLRMLSRLSRIAPLVLMLHDAWLLSGHCAHSLGCDRWRTGCGDCPDLTIYPAVRRDRTARNWRVKRRIFADSTLFVATPCAWLMERVRASMLQPAIQDQRVIPNGVDLTVFKPHDRAAARRAVGVPDDVPLLLFAASGIRDNPFKDFRTLRTVIQQVAAEHTDVTLVALGEAAPDERFGDTTIRFVPFEPDPTRVARWFQAADLYVHAARADTFPTTVLEALACGTPVVATAVGGIPEQVRSLSGPAVAAGVTTYEVDTASGFLVGAEHATAFVGTVQRLLLDPDLCQRLGENAARDARHRFDVERQGDVCLQWFETITQQWQRERARSAAR